MNLRFRAFAVALSLAASTGLASLAAAQGAVEASPEEATLYAAWSLASDAKDAAKAMETAREYLKQFPKGAYAEYLGKWIVTARGAAFNEAIKAGDMDAMIRTGKQRLAEDPQDLDYLLAMVTQLRRNELFANPPKDTHAAELLELVGSAIAAVEAGRTPSGDPAKFNKNATLAMLAQNTALVAQRQGKDEEALAGFARSSSFDPGNAQINMLNALQCATIRTKRYSAAATRFQDVPEDQRKGPDLGPDAKAALEEVNREADGAIECWARFVAISEVKNAAAERREAARKSLNDLWAYRHPQDPQGAQKVVDAQKAALPSGN
jgi:hypothetical protein